jgi:hypothetical protein
MANLQSITLFYSDYSKGCNQIRQLITSNYDKFIEYQSIDNPIIRKKIIKSGKIKNVPCFIIMYTNGRVEKYEGNDAFEWFINVDTKMRNAQIEQHNQSQQVEKHDQIQPIEKSQTMIKGMEKHPRPETRGNPEGTTSIDDILGKRPMERQIKGSKSSATGKPTKDQMKSIISQASVMAKQRAEYDAPKRPPQIAQDNTQLEEKYNEEYEDEDEYYSSEDDNTFEETTEYIENFE